jgi:hypothetical protein
VQKTIESQRQRLLEHRDNESALVRDELEAVQLEMAEARALIARAQRDHESDAITPNQWSRLDADYRQRLELGEHAIERLRARLSNLQDNAPSTQELDGLLDRLDSLVRIVSGHLTADDTPRLNLQLCEVFEEFRVTRSGDRLIVEPKLRPEWIPPGTWHRLDFGDDDHGGETVVEVVEYFEPALRKVDLTSPFVTDDLVGSSRSSGSVSDPAGPGTWSPRRSTRRAGRPPSSCAGRRSGRSSCPDKA